MGDSRPGNGGGWPPEEGGGGLPDLPPEWGMVVIPDDASELDREAYALRRELRREARRSRVRSLVGRRDAGRTGLRLKPGAHRQGEPALAIPLVIMAVAVLTTMISLFVVTLGRQTGVPTQSTDPGSATATNDQTGSGAAGANTGLLDVVLRDEAGGPIRVGNLLPAIVLLAGSCNCPGLVLDVAARAPTGVRVIAVGRTAPSIPKRPANVVSLADPADVLRRYQTGTGSSPTAPTALIVSRSGEIVTAVNGLTKAADLPPIDTVRLG